MPDVGGLESFELRGDYVEALVTSSLRLCGQGAAYGGAFTAETQRRGGAEDISQEFVKYTFRFPLLV